MEIITVVLMDKIITVILMEKMITVVRVEKMISLPSFSFSSQAQAIGFCILM